MTVEQGHIAIVGGGTAGWLAALVLQKTFEKANLKSGAVAPRISVIESPNIPTVGVGEGSTSLLRQILLDLRIDETEFLRETGATFKYGILHKNWGAQNGSYFGPIDDPHFLVPAPRDARGSWLHTSRIGSGKPVQDAHLFTYLMRSRKAPFTKTRADELVPVSPLHHAYHFDQARLGRYLAKKAVGIEHIRAEVRDIGRHTETGDVQELLMEDGAAMAVDFVIDCTGFRRAIISRMGATWHSYSDILPLNKAMPFWIENEENIGPYTEARACSAGWMWRIPTQERMGCGYVFSDAHLTEEAAQAEIAALLGQTIAPRGLISIDPGRQAKAWIGNCVSLGLAQSFLEPLEATSIHGTLVQLLMLSQSASELAGGETVAARERYNNTVAGQLDDYAHFINLHYAGGRRDSSFWEEMTASGLSQTVRDRLNIWEKEPVRREHFPPFPDALPHVQEQLHIPVLDGLGLLPRGPSKNEMSAFPKVRMEARKTVDRLIVDFRNATRQAIDHSAYLRSISPSSG